MGSPAPAACGRWQRLGRRAARDAGRPLSDAAGRSAWRLLRQRNFGPYFVGNAASASGTWFQNLAASILIYRLTHSPFLLGVLNFCQFVPVLVLSPWAGALADRVDRRKLLIVTQSSAAILSGSLAALAFSGHAGKVAVIAFAAALGVAVAISQPSQLALVSSLVPREDVSQAVALNSATFNLARAIGPVSAAAVIAWKGVGVAFAVNACSFLVLTAALLVVRPLPYTRAARARLRDGIALVLKRRSLLLYLLVVASVSAGSDPVNTESPAWAHVFGYSSSWAGTIVGAFGVGAVTAAFFFSHRLRGSRGRMALTLGVMGVGMTAFALSPWLPLAYVFLAVAGFGYLISNASATSQIQLSVDEHERGRVMALWSIAFLGVRPLSSLIDGAIAGAFGVRAAAVALAVPLLVGAAAAGALARREHQPERALEPSP